jgi:hypothetical protein
MIALTIILAYIANIFLNRWIYFQIQKLDSESYPNTACILACFLSLHGTAALLVIWFIIWTEVKGVSANMPKIEFFKYKNKQ